MIKLKSLIPGILKEDLSDIKNMRIHLSEKEITQMKHAEGELWGKGCRPNGLYYAFGDVWMNYLFGNTNQDDHLGKRKYIYEVILSPSTRILKPITYEDFYKLHIKYGKSSKVSKVTPDNIKNLSPFDLTLNWDLVSKDFDAFEIESFDVINNACNHSEPPVFYWPGEFEPPHGVVWNEKIVTLRKLPTEYIQQYIDSRQNK